MGYDIYIRDPSGNTILSERPHFLKGSTHAAGGTRDLYFCCTYNDAPWLIKAFPAWPVRGGIQPPPGLRGLDGLELDGNMDVLLAGIRRLDRDEDAKAWTFRKWREGELARVAALPPIPDDAGTMHGLLASSREVPEEYSYWTPSPANALGAINALVAMTFLVPVSRPRATWSVT